MQPSPKQLPSPFSTVHTPPDLKQYLPYPATPWQVNPDLFNRLQQSPLSSYKKCQVLPSDREWDFIWNLFYADKPTQYKIGRIYCIHKATHTETFQNTLIDIEKEASKFFPQWKTEGLVDQRTKVINRWKHITGCYPPIHIENRTDIFNKTKVLPLWHGTKPEISSSICDTGYTIFGKHNWKKDPSIDPGFFGNGIYFTSSAHYASLYSKEGHLLLAFVSMREPFPVVSDGTPPGMLPDMKRLKGRSAYDRYNAHYIPVISTNPNDPTCKSCYPCSPTQQPMYDEFVVFKQSQTLTRFCVELQVDFPLIPFPPSPHTMEKLSNLALAILSHPEVQKDSKLQKALKDQTEVLLLASETTFLSEEDLAFYNALSNLLNQQEKINTTARKQILKSVANKHPSQKIKSDTFLKKIQKNISRSNHQEAWSNFRLFCRTIDKNSDPKKIRELYALLGKILPALSLKEKQILFTYVFPKLNLFPKLTNEQMQLASHLAQWHLQQIKTTAEDQRLKEVYIPAMFFFTQAVAIATKYKPEKSQFLHIQASNIFSLVFQEQIPHYQSWLTEVAKQKDLQGFKTIIQQLLHLKTTFGIDVSSFFSQARDILLSFPSAPFQSSIMELQEEGIPATPVTKRYQQASQGWEKSWQTAHKTLANTSPTSIRALQKKMTQEFISLFRDLFFKDSLSLIGKLPCDFDLCAWEDLGKEMPSPYTPLQWMILIQETNSKASFTKFAELIELQSVALGKAIPGYPRFSSLTSGLSPCLSFDIPLSINTPQANPTTAFSTIPLTHTCALFKDYQVETQKRLNASHKQLAKQHFDKQRYFLEIILACPFGQEKMVDIQQQFIQPIETLLTVLALYHEIQPTNTLGLIDTLANKRAFTKESAHLLKEAVASLYLIKTRLSLIYKQQQTAAWITPQKEASFLIPISSQETNHLLSIYWLAVRPLFFATQQMINRSQQTKRVDLKNNKIGEGGDKASREILKIGMVQNRVAIHAT